MGRNLILAFALGVFALAGCDEPSGRMAHPEDPDGRYHEQISAARRVLEQNENWAGRAEWEVVPSDDGWKVVAWRIEHPEAKGADRYSPVGYSVIELDRRMAAVHYLPKK